jgi:hypothetical protein
MLIIEACLIIILVAALMVLLAWALRWLHDHVIPPLHEALPVIRNAFNATDRASGQVVDVIAALYGRRKGLEVGVKSFVAALKPILFSLFTPDENSQPQTSPTPPPATTPPSTP